MFDRLKILYELQNLDDQLDVLEELRGDLPNAVGDLKEKITVIKTDIANKEKEKKESLEKRKDNEEEIDKLKENQKSLKHSFTKLETTKSMMHLLKKLTIQKSNLLN